ncbi:PREDICTED: uncharacterized protein LOC104728362 [Camelina sativa]|uniref:Uncharacterized protein LOC104728362 n=1 Tax=Camelina sativa TaxID=90675 RepID=A0ABM0USP2_CAMSA|nr:PREDICTED: uncharacterized protein LOC104728362 [Camelina sativa]
MEEAINRLTEAVTAGREGGGAAVRGNHRHVGQEQQLQPVNRGENLNPFSQGRTVKLEFPRFKGGDPTAWISKVKQYFDYNHTLEDQKVGFASYHLEDEANEWWQATSKALREDGINIAWPIFEEELWVRFGPVYGEDFDEALSKIQQTGTLQEYQ